MKRHFGGNSYRTNPGYYGARDYGTAEQAAFQLSHHIKAFNAVVARLRELSELREKYIVSRWEDTSKTMVFWDNPVDLIYIDDESPDRRVIAYRYTSDTAYRRYRDEVQKIASGLGFGVWDGTGPHSYEQWFGPPAEGFDADKAKELLEQYLANQK